MPARRESRVQGIYIYEDVYMCTIYVLTPTYASKFVRFASLCTATVAYAFCIQWPHQCRLNPLYRGENRSVFLRGRGRRPGTRVHRVHPCDCSPSLSYHRSPVQAMRHYSAPLYKCLGIINPSRLQWTKYYTLYRAFVYYIIHLAFKFQIRGWNRAFPSPIALITPIIRDKQQRYRSMIS